MRLGKCGDATGEGRNFRCFRKGGQIKGHGFGEGGKIHPVTRLEPGGEMPPIASVSAAGILSERMAEKLLGARKDVVQGEFPAVERRKLLRIVIASGTPGSITLRGGSEDGTDQTILRKI